MRHFRFPLAAVLAAALAAPAPAQPPVHFEDAAVHAVQFYDANEGWAVGDDGTIWHSINGGTNWERQKSGTRASLRAVHFLTPYSGWAVGRTELPSAGGSVGVMLRTADGGLTWDEVGTNVLPGLHVVRFFDEKSGFVCGDGSDAFPTGMFFTADGGRTWKPVPGPRIPGWRCADFPNSQTGSVGGAWSHLGSLKTGAFAAADFDPLGGRAVHGLKFGSQRGFAVGDGGLVLASSDGGQKWGSVNVGVSPASLAACDFKCVAAFANHVWVAGRPGSFVLHSADAGKTWEVCKTGLTCPVNGIQFLDEKTGWIVGELGTIAGTNDGGKTWKVQRLGGQRAAVLFLQARSRSVPLEAVSLVGGGDGYYCTALSVMTADPATADPKKAHEAARLRSAMRHAGGVCGECVWSFPLPAHAAGLPPMELMATWDRAHGGRANEQLLRQSVLAIRTWQPEVIVADVASTDAHPCDVLVLHAAKEAFKQAADPNCFPEQITELGLQPWAPKKLYAMSPDDPTAPVKLDFTAFHNGLADTPKDYAEAGVRIAADESASTNRRCFKLVAHRLQGAEGHANLMDGIPLARGGAARRPDSPAGDAAALAERQKAAQSRRHLEGLGASANAELGGSDRILAALGAQLPKLPDDIAARAAFGVGMQLARAGKWSEAREVFALLLAKYPGHPLSMEAYRWLLRYHASSETRRRVEIQQKLAFKTVSFQPGPGGARQVVPANANGLPATTTNVTEDVYRLYSPDMIYRWHQTCLDFEPRLSAFGPVYARDPSAWLNFLAARRQIGKHAEAQQFVGEYFKLTPGATAQAPGLDPWRDCLASELWLTQPTAMPAAPKPLGQCRRCDTRPFLDGKLDDPCWTDAKPIGLKPVAAASDRADDLKAFGDAYRTEARFSFDDQFLYIAASCTHPVGMQVPAAAKRMRDADLSGRDRVDILLDMDRDYQTYYRFQIDQRGCLAEDCWGDRTWNPKYYVAFLPSETGWTAEIAIPLVELTGDRPGHGRAWAANVSRMVPGKGVQAWSGPADTEPRPEGMGLLQFRVE